MKTELEMGNTSDIQDSDVAAIEVCDVWKSYRSGALWAKTLWNEIRSFFAKLCGKGNGNTEIVRRKDISLQSIGNNQRFWAVKGISFSVKKGEVVAILGRNGAGKSSLLQVLARITEADKGVVKIRGKIASLLGAGVGFNDEMTGRENVYLNGSILGMTPSEVSERLDKIAEFAEIPEFIDTPVKRYSSGMKARLGFAVAVHLDSEVMILDEVFATGDRVFRSKCIDKMKDLANEGRTILIVTHMPSLLAGVCSRGIVMRDGSSCFDGDIDTAIDLYLEKIDLDSIETDDKKTADDIYLKWEQLKIVDERGSESMILDKNSSRTVKFDVTFLEKVKGVQAVVLLRSVKAGILARFAAKFDPKCSYTPGQTYSGVLNFEGLPLSAKITDVQCTVRIMGNLDGERIILSNKTVMLGNSAPTSTDEIGIFDCSHQWEIDGATNVDQPVA